MRMMLLALYTSVVVISLVCAPRPALSSQESTGENWFMLVGEFVAADPESTPEVAGTAKAGMFDGYGFWPPITPAMTGFLEDGRYGLVLYLPAATSILPRYNSVESSRFPTSMQGIEPEEAAVRKLTAALGTRIWWDAMPEFDSSGHWGAYRLPKPSSREDAYRTWTQYYLNFEPLGRYLRMTPEQRGFHLAACSGNAYSTHYAYEMGVELVLLERTNDDLGDMQVGVPFVRGAGAQYDRPWGIDISTWRSATDSPTFYDESGKLVGGFSDSYFKRNFFLAYFAGANLLHLEPAEYHYGELQLTPYGQTVAEFRDFIRRHPERGVPEVPAAIMLDLYHGFEPPHGQVQFAPDESVWYGHLPYSAGDAMTAGFLKLAFPDYWMSGATPNGPWVVTSRFGRNPEAMRKLIENGGDVRPYEPLANTRWGNSIDVLLSNASPEALRTYRTIVLTGDVSLDGRLRRAFQNWVEEGGCLIANVAHVGAADEGLLGVKLTDRQAQSARSRWLADGTSYGEPTYTYTVVEPQGAEAIADNGEGAPLITSHRLGKGEVILTTPDHLSAADYPGRLLTISTRLFDTAMSRHAVAEVEGPPVSYVVTRAPGKTILALINTSGDHWAGKVVLDRPTGEYRTLEWMEDRELGHEETGRKVRIPVGVPPYDVRVVVLEEVAG